MEITGPCKGEPKEAIVLDRLNGTYEVQYFVPTAGEYEITVAIDENPYDGNSVYMPVRGFPCKVDFGESWDEIKVGGVWPKLKGWMRAWAPDDASIVVVVKEEEDKGVPDYPSDRELGLVVDPPKPLPEPLLKFSELSASAIAKAGGDDIQLRITQTDAPEGRLDKDKQIRSNQCDTSPESLPEPEKLKRLNMASLKALLQVRGLPTDGMKYLLVARLDQNRGAPLNADSNAAAAAAEAADVAWRVRDPSRAPDCQCGVPCKEKTVRKEGPNKGKTFWACRRPKQAAPCGFFQWRTGMRKPVAAAPRSATRAAVTSSAPPAAAPTVDVRGGSDMFEDLVIMSSRPRARDAAAA